MHASTRRHSRDFVVGWLRSGGVQSPYLPHAERRSSTEAANKEVACELKRCDKRKGARSEYHHYTVLYKALTLMDVKLPAITKTLIILVANISGFTVVKEVRLPKPL